MWEARMVQVVRAIASHQCGRGSNPGVNTTCGLSLLFILAFALKGFFGVFQFSPLLKNQHFQIPIRPGMVVKDLNHYVCGLLSVNSRASAPCHAQITSLTLAKFHPASN